MTLKILIVLLSALNSVYASSELHKTKEDRVHIHGSHKECPLPKSSNDIIACALSFHPNIKRSLFKIDSSTKLEDRASQTPNPILTTRYVKGELDGGDISELEANLGFTLELGGKRGSRVEFAKEKKSQALAINESIMVDVKTSTILNLHILRQMIGEKKLLLNTLKAYSEIINQLKKLPRLTPEQEASLTLFEMSYEEIKINEAELFEKERELEHYFHISTGHSLSEILKYLPSLPQKWPIISKSKGKEVSSEVKKFKVIAKLAQAELNIESANAWPDLKVGPSIAIENEDGVENQMIGFNIQIPIPLFQLNGGAKAYARSELIRAQKNVVLTKAEESHERFEQLRVYESSVKILKKTMRQEDINLKYNKIQKLHARGVVSSSVYLDSIKQILSYLRSRNQRELTALKSMWSIYKYDGNILKEKI